MTGMQGSTIESNPMRPRSLTQVSGVASGETVALSRGDGNLLSAIKILLCVTTFRLFRFLSVPECIY